MYRITIKTDNAAFEDAGTGTEIARILRRLADECDGREPQSIPLFDYNGNKVGQAKAS